MAASPSTAPSRAASGSERSSATTASVLDFAAIDQAGKDDALIMDLMRRRTKGLLDLDPTVERRAGGSRRGRRGAGPARPAARLGSRRAIACAAAARISGAPTSAADSKAATTAGDDLARGEGQHRLQADRPVLGVIRPRGAASRQDLGRDAQPARRPDQIPHAGGEFDQRDLAFPG